MREIGYNDSPLLLSMWACICLTDTALKVPLDNILGQQKKLIAFVTGFYRCRGWAPHPDTMLAVLEGRGAGAAP